MVSPTEPPWTCPPIRCGWKSSFALSVLKTGRGSCRYLMEVERIYRTAEEQFFSRSFSVWQDFVSPRLGAAFLSVHPFLGMDAFHQRYFRDPRLLAMMNRYATYVGSSPYETPATLSMIAYLELVRGVYYIPGGNYRLVEALERLARRTGVEIRTGVRTEAILERDGRIRGVQAGGETLQADFVVSNADYFTTRGLITDGGSAARESAGGRRTSSRFEGASLSSSGFLCLFGLKGRVPGLHHHNLYYPENYGSEFADIFRDRQWPALPALYVCASSATEPERAADGTGTNLYVLINVPPEVPVYRRTRDGQPAGGTAEDARREREHTYRSLIVRRLAEAWGLPARELEARIEAEAVFGPDYIASRTGAYGGALYGSASHGWRETFFRPAPADRRIRGLYYAGGSTHPGGGTPMVTLSGINAARLIAARHR
ncbi:CrtNb [Paenibacillus mucilaginosus 3016]|uniref:4,4'-diaponeurosporene oxygenase n=1 Tax=Paenibacillus mucilaginosus 3016 TaxID=1116391 RepID=H6ND65_9BACL|nr:FAD-dependent oxidoreductase [Paenibacillus mucilaginosus]AFC30026.1 CrtNb [Paenibacillus mucilaginosus 3016]